MGALPTRSSIAAGFFAVFVLVPSSFADDALLRINCGSNSSFTDVDGNVWQKDTYFSGGSKYSVPNPIEGTLNDGLYQTERYGDPFSYSIPIANGVYEVVMHHCELFFQADNKRVFDITAESQDAASDFDVHALTGGRYVALQHSVVVTVLDGAIDLSFDASKDNGQIVGLEVLPHDSGHPFLHVVILGEEFTADYTNAGSVPLIYDGTDSHTHEFGHAIVGYEWRLNGNLIGTDPILEHRFDLGEHDLSLTILDDNVPPETLTDSIHITVDPPGAVSGALARYFDRGNQPFSNVRIRWPVYMEVLPSLKIEAVGANIGNSPLSSDVRVRLVADVDLPSTGQYEFIPTGADGGRITVDGTTVRGPVNLSAGTHRIRWNPAIDATAQLPAELLMSFNGSVPAPIDPLLISHDQRSLDPFINPFPNQGSIYGGEEVRITGVGFFPVNKVELHWGDETYIEPAFQRSPYEIVFTTTPVASEQTIKVQVETLNGASNEPRFHYLANVPVDFQTQVLDLMNQPGVLQLGPDGRLYVASVQGRLRWFEFDDDYAIVDSGNSAAIFNLSNSNVLGMAFDPTANPADPVRVYLVHNELYANGGDCFTGISEYSGQISYLEAPDFDVVHPVVTGLPVSNHDHGNNAMFFDEYGDLYLVNGGNTNAGIPACPSGGLPESPLTSCVMKFPLSDPGFNGTITYLNSSDQLLNMDQVDGGTVDIAPGVSVETYLTGTRNTFDMVLTTANDIFGWDNGPNTGFGAKSTGPDTEGSAPQGPDDFNRLVEDAYYGHPNRNRGRYDLRENFYKHSSDPHQIYHHSGPWYTDSSARCGIIEYRSNNFGGRIRGALISQKWNGQKLVVAHLSPDRHSLDLIEEYEFGLTGLTLATGPGGVIFGSDYSDGEITISRPVDPSLVLMTAVDIHPWRAPSSGGTPFVIGGANFPDISHLHVTIGGVACALSSVSPTTIRGVIPPAVSPSAELLDVMVHDHHMGRMTMIEDAFRYLLSPLEGVGVWTSIDDAPPASLAQTTCSDLGGVIYLFGEGDATTYAYDHNLGLWHTSLAQRPHVGGSHCSVSYDETLFLLGGSGGGSEGQVQIYDPFTNVWSLGTPAPFAVGGAMAVEIDGLIYLAGGVLPASGTTNDQIAVYDPVLDSWTTLSSMPVGRNRAFAGTDGEQMWIFGGRGPGSGEDGSLAEGFDSVLVYDPQSDTWEQNGVNSSVLNPVPRNASAGGRAIYLRGEFYLVGGSTTDVGVIDGAESRVDVYHVDTNSWRSEAPLGTPRFGHDPILFDRRIWVIGGGSDVAVPAGDALENFHR